MSYLTIDDDVKIYYEDSGEGETLVFCHGLNSSHTANEEFYNEFKDDFRVVLYDQRGHENSDKPTVHMTVERLGRDLNEIIETLDLNEITLIGHSMGAATIYSYVNQFGCDKIRRIVACDMSPYMRNDGWTGGIAQGEWSDEDFYRDFDRIFDDVGSATWHIAKNMMNPDLKNTPPDEEEKMIALFRDETNPFTMAAFWYSLFRTDQRPAIDKITVPFLYLMPDYPLYSMVAIDYMKEHVKDEFVLKNDFPGTTHAIWREMPQEVACEVKKFIEKY